MFQTFFQKKMQQNLRGLPTLAFLYPHGPSPLICNYRWGGATINPN
jgi:hypothetical protein